MNTREGERRLAIAVGGTAAVVFWLWLGWLEITEGEIGRWNTRDRIITVAVTLALYAIGWGTIRVVGWVIRGFRHP